ncbi:MAG: FHA domain-containing protein [Actinomycetota bacterium]|nr:FHA domain-containing protein [Actinomycetota bacterium]
MQLPGSSRQRLAHALNAAYADGLLSEQTLAYRLDLLFRSRLVDPVGLVGDLSGRTARHVWRATIANALEAAGLGLRRIAGRQVREDPQLLALDWRGAQEELLLGRHPACDVVLSDLSVSRRHARLRFHDGAWTLRDLDSTNGTKVNGLRVGRCALRPGDRVALGTERLVVD